MASLQSSVAWITKKKIDEMQSTFVLPYFSGLAGLEKMFISQKVGQFSHNSCVLCAKR